MGVRFNPFHPITLECVHFRYFHASLHTLRMGFRLLVMRLTLLNRCFMIIGLLPCSPNEHQIINVALELLNILSSCHEPVRIRTRSIVKQSLAFYLQADLLLCMLLSLVTFGLVAVAMFCMYYLMTSSDMGPGRLSKYWSKASIGVFLGVVVKCRQIAVVI